MRLPPSAAALPLILALAGCVAAPAQVTMARPGGSTGSDAGPAAPAAPPPMATAPAGTAGHGDAEMAATFMDLTFAMESGRQLDRFSRFEGPITVAMTGPVPAGAAEDLSRVLQRLRAEAGIEISHASTGTSPSILIDFTPRAAMRRLAPNAACFVVPNVTSLADYRARRGTEALDWAAVIERRKVAVFIPADASPQEVRDCLHEELAQAIGPLNDLYRLSDSIFNDDNFNSVLTPFDMTILRAYYAPELRAGMTRDEVQARIGAIMARENGRGAGRGTDLSPTPRGWITAIETALSADHANAARRSAAARALAIARAQGWTDARLAFSHFALARLLVGPDRDRALAEFAEAARLYRSLPGGAIHVAHIDMQLAALAVASGQPDRAVALADRALPAIRAAQNQALLATTLLIKAEALDQLGLPDQAQALRVDSRAAARYGFGSEAQVRARQREISALGGHWPPQG